MYKTESDAAALPVPYSDGGIFSQMLVVCTNCLFNTTISISLTCASKLAQARIIEMIKEQHEQKALFVTNIHPGGLKSDFSRTMPEKYQRCKTCLSLSLQLCFQIIQRLPVWKKHCVVLTDPRDLAFGVWLLARNQGLNGRLSSSKWDVNELLGKMDEIMERLPQNKVRNVRHCK